MQFVKSEDANEGTAALVARIAKELEDGRKVLWLVSGGSNVHATVAAMHELTHEHPQWLAGLTLMLMDERYGPVRHPDSNFHQLMQAGLVLGDAQFIQTLANASFEDTVRYFGQAFKEAVERHPVIVGQFGMGSDGHTAGVLPHSPGVESQEDAIGYLGAKYGGKYQRITLTLKALQNVSLGYCFVFGEDKLKALQNLHNKALSTDEQPAQILHTIKEVYVYNNHIGGES